MISVRSLPLSMLLIGILVGATLTVANATCAFNAGLM